ncbi:TetR/AcrR family transcriptional regulator [Nocardioides nitrophenolicus]|uniref:TetR/AcrR family transcriptional regulator n=1 Tax=Nocardioides nitrophenolicus TaxID=60489 RepID=UPI00195DB35B|nr:TetR/AcrR family transcriptional regulator [Nocardioides nitrophenolicus]MBM7517780.1 AcrR family transcriptional regulator [Nocardioides nitrophenolicus]
MSWVDRRTPAVERILDAAGGLIAERGVDAVAMGEIARAAGCSRATLYRYFPDRLALQRAFVQREAVRVGALVAAEAPATVTEAALAALRHVRAAPTLAAWFREGDAGRSAGLAHDSEVVEALGLSLVADREAAAWLVRVIVSLLTVPGGDEAAERRLVDRFVAPVIALTTP